MLSPLIPSPKKFPPFLELWINPIRNSIQVDFLPHRFFFFGKLLSQNSPGLERWVWIPEPSLWEIPEDIPAARAFPGMLCMSRSGNNPQFLSGFLAAFLFMREGKEEIPGFRFSVGSQPFPEEFQTHLSQEILEWAVDPWLCQEGKDSPDSQA